jgi:hypothetical protein
MAPAIDVCTDYGIDTVTMKVLSGDNVLASAGYPCTQHSGTLNNIPAGNNLVLRLDANVPGAGIVWAGDTAFNLSAGQTKNIGKVVMSYTGTADTTSPSVLSVSPDNNATNVLDTSVILIRFSERMAINTVQDREAILVTDNVSGQVAGVITYLDNTNTAQFTPAAPLGSGRKHTVTVGTLVTDMASRPMIKPYVSSFLVHKKGDWYNPTLIEENNTAGTYNPKVAINGNGDAVAVWEQSDGTQVNIWANRYTSSTKKWGIPALVEQSSGDQVDPRVVVDGTGNAIVVWRSKFSTTGSFGNLTGYDIISTTYSAQTGTWKPPGRISLFNYGLPPSGYDKHDPRVAIDGTGNAVAIWIQDNNVWANRYTASTKLWDHNISLEPLATIIDNIAGVSSNPEIAMDSSGNAIAVWQQDGGGQTHIWANRYSSSTGTWGSATLIDDHVIGFADSPKVALDENGSAVVVWGWAATGYPPPSNYKNVWSNQYTASSGTWGTPTQIQGSTEHAILIQVAVGGIGNATAVWVQGNGLWANRYTASTGWGTAATRIVDGTGGIHIPTLGMDGNGNAIVLWGNNPLSSNLWFSRYVKETGSWGAATVLNNGAGSAGIPEVSVNQGGNAVAVWLQADEFRYNLWANQSE